MNAQENPAAAIMNRLRFEDQKMVRRFVNAKSRERAEIARAGFTALLRLGAAVMEANGEYVEPAAKEGLL